MDIHYNRTIIQKKLVTRQNYNMNHSLSCHLLLYANTLIFSFKPKVIGKFQKLSKIGFFVVVVDDKFSFLKLLKACEHERKAQKSSYQAQ